MIDILISYLILLFISKPHPVVETTRQLAQHEFSLEKRYQNSYVNGIFKDNVLLTLDYLSEAKIKPGTLEYKLVLEPGELFAFHEDVLPKYQGMVSKTTNAHFNSKEGFKSDGFLVGDGVCHLASLLYWVAKDAGLLVEAPTRHDFAPVPEVPREYGVSIYYYPGRGYRNKAQNLYIKNNRDKEVIFEFKIEGEKLKISAAESLAAPQHQKISSRKIEPVRRTSAFV